MTKHVSLSTFGPGLLAAATGAGAAEGLPACRVDLALGHAMTARFGVSVDRRRLPGRYQWPGCRRGAGHRRAHQFGARPSFTAYPAWDAGRRLLEHSGVWQSAPYLFAGFLSLRRSGLRGTKLRGARQAYRGLLMTPALASLAWLWPPVRTLHLVYGTLGAGFLPLLPITPLVMNNRRAWVGELRNGWTIKSLLVRSCLSSVLSTSAESPTDIRRVYR